MKTAFYEDQKDRRIGKCLDIALPLTISDKKLIRRSESQLNATYSFKYQSEIILSSAAGYTSQTESLASDEI